MSVEMTVPEMMVGGAPPPEEPPKEKIEQAKMTWTCSRCGAEMNWLPESVRHLPPSAILCINCVMAKKAAKASAAAPSKPTNASTNPSAQEQSQVPESTPEVPAPAPVQTSEAQASRSTREALARHLRRRPAGGPNNRRAPAPRVLTLDAVELCAFRIGIPAAQVDELLATLRRHLSSDVA